MVDDLAILVCNREMLVEDDTEMEMLLAGYDDVARVTNLRI